MTLVYNNNEWIEAHKIILTLLSSLLKEMAVEDSLICKYNQTGFCKYREGCKNKHVNDECEKSKCDKKDCEKDTQRNAKNTLTTNVDSTKNVPTDIAKL